MCWIRRQSNIFCPVQGTTVLTVRQHPSGLKTSPSLWRQLRGTFVFSSFCPSVNVVLTVYIWNSFVSSFSFSSFICWLFFLLSYPVISSQPPVLGVKRIHWLSWSASHLVTVHLVLKFIFISFFKMYISSSCPPSLSVGSVWVNSHSISDPCLPVSGHKDSGTCTDGGQEVCFGSLLFWQADRAWISNTACTCWCSLMFEFSFTWVSSHCS